MGSYQKLEFQDYHPVQAALSRHRSLWIALVSRVKPSTTRMSQVRFRWALGIRALDGAETIWETMAREAVHSFLETTSWFLESLLRKLSRVLLLIHL